MNNLRDSYKLYKEKTEKPIIDIKTYLDIVNGFMKFIMSKVFEGYEVRLPRIGTVSIVGNKIKPRIGEDGEIKGLAPNWAETKKLWDKNPTAKANKQLVYCFNEHTNGIRYKLLWAKKGVIIQNKKVYTLKFSRANKRKVNKLANEGKEYYVINK